MKKLKKLEELKEKNRALQKENEKLLCKTYDLEARLDFYRRKCKELGEDKEKVYKAIEDYICHSLSKAKDQNMDKDHFDLLIKIIEQYYKVEQIDYRCNL